jgi:hypothetical protein
MILVEPVNTGEMGNHRGEIDLLVVRQMAGLGA